MTLKRDGKFEEKLALDSRNDVRNLVSFNASSVKSENLLFDMLLLPIGYEVLAKKYRRVISHNTEKIQTLKKSWLFIRKMTWGIWWTLTRALESMKICTLMDYFCKKYVMFELKNTEELCHEEWLMFSKIT